MPIINLEKLLLEYNFTSEDISQHGNEILEQLWYELSIDNINFIGVD